MHSDCRTHVVVVHNFLVYCGVEFLAISVVAIVGFVVCFKTAELQIFVPRDVHTGFVPVRNNPNTFGSGLVYQVEFLCDPSQIFATVVEWIAIDVIEYLENCRQWVQHKVADNTVE